MIAVMVLLITLTAVLPDILTEGQREREEELLSRGNEYARAIATYHIRFNRYPMKIDDLVKGMNGMKFLRHAYPDPMTRSGKWRYIHANAAGVVVDSRMLKNLGPMSPGGMGAPGGSMGTGFGGGMGGSSSGFSLGPMGSSSGGFGAGPSGNAPGGIAPSQDNGQSQGAPSAFGPEQGGANPGQGTTPGSQGTTQESGFGFSNQTVGLFIVGVASTSHKKSFLIYNKQKYYDDWEFLGLPTMMTGGMSAMPGMSGVPGGATTPTPSGMGGTQPNGAFPPILGNPSTNP
jgi:type II secretory pathway pseudopilin PulG